MKNVELKSMLYQRLTLGIMCAVLVPACILFGLFGLSTNPSTWYKSISDTYYANSKMFMIGLLFATSVFFFTYKGYDKKDRICSLIQAISSMGIIVFPCVGTDSKALVGLFNLPAGFSHKIHCVFASILFIAFAINLLFLFTLGNGEATEQKKKRNRIYRACGIIIFIFIVIQALVKTVFKAYIPSWIPVSLINEFVMLEAFAFAYIVKSEAIKRFNDNYKEVQTVIKEVEKPSETTEPVKETPTETKPECNCNCDEPIKGFFQKVGILIDSTIYKFRKLFKKK